MIDHPIFLGGTIGTVLVASFYLWRAQAIATWFRIAAIFLVLLVAGTIAGVIDLNRLVELILSIGGRI